MIYKVYTVFDSKSDEFKPPFFCKSPGEATRIMKNLLADKSHDFYKYANEFILFELGTYDDSLGKFENLVAPLSISLLSVFCEVDS